MKVCSVVITVLIFCIACTDRVPHPKPRTYPRIFFPEKKYKSIDLPYCSFQCEVPEYSKVERDTLFFDSKPVSDCWFNLNYPRFNGTLFCSYIPITNRDSLTRCIRDAYKLALQHQTKANYVDEIPIRKPNKVYGIVFNLEGATASPFQFYVTDSLQHFFRGSLYFHTKTRPDSIAPIAEFIKADIIQMMNTFEWR